MSGRFDDIASMLVRKAPPTAASFRGLISSGGEKWAGGLSRSGAGVAIHHTTARRNARAAMQDSVQARAVVERSADTIADGGLRLELAPVVEILGISREYATDWSRDVEARFDLWARSKGSHRSGIMNWYQSHQFWQLCRHRDNDQFVRFFYDPAPELLNPLQYEFLDPDMIRGDALTIGYGYGDYTSTAGWQNNADDGVIRDEWGRETGYKVWVKQKDGSYKSVDLPATYPGGRLAMVHGFTPEYPGQGRGYSRLAHAVQEFENITDFSASVIKKAINQSNIFAFVKPAKDEDASNPIESLFQDGGAGPAAAYLGQDPQNVGGLPPVDRAGVEDFCSIPEAQVRTPGSLFVASLTKGADISFPANTAPGDTFDKFVDSFAGYISASLRIPLEVVLMKFGQNYSASRATLLLFWRVAVIERAEMATDYLNPVVEMWMSEEIAAGRVIAPGWTDPRLRAAWINCTWIGSGPPDIDPGKSAKARRDNLELGATNIERESRDLNGTSAADNISKNNAAYKKYEPLPWNEPGNPPPGTAPAPTPKAEGSNVLMLRVLDEIQGLRDDIEEMRG